MNNMKAVVVKIYRDKIFFSDKDFLDMEHVNLPIEHITFTMRPIYWELMLKSYNKDSGLLSVFINNYDYKPSEKWVGKTPKSEIRYITFLNIDWDRFKACLVYYDGHARQSLADQSSQDKFQPVKKVSLLHKVRIKDLNIHQGYVAYMKKVNWAREPVEIRIPHKDMFSKLNFVKPYFSKIIGKKTIEVDLVISRQDGNTIYHKVASNDLRKINKDSLYVIKSFETDAIRKKMRRIQGNNIFMEEIDLSLDELAFGNIDDLERDLLFSVLEQGNILNSQQLIYLSEVMDSSQRLMITLEPQFGFIFTIKGEEMIHCIWELINSHATYIWSFPAEALTRKHIKRLEQEFAIITTHGRSHYRNHFEANDDLYLHIVHHKRRSDPMVDHFAEWRLKLESLMV
jgi:hypothetical protein